MLLPFLTIIIFGLQQIDAEDSHRQRCELMLKTDFLQKYVSRSLQDWLSSSDCHKDIKKFKNCSKYINSADVFDYAPILTLYNHFELYSKTKSPMRFIEDCDQGYAGLGDKASSLIMKGNLSADQAEEFMCELILYWNDKGKCFKNSSWAGSMIFNYVISVMNPHCVSSREQRCESNLRNKFLKRYVSGSFKDWFASRGCQNDMDDYRNCQNNTLGKSILQLYQLLASMCSHDQVTIFEDCDPCHEALGESDSTMIKQGNLSMNQTEDIMCKLMLYWKNKEDCFQTQNWPQTVGLNLETINSPDDNSVNFNSIQIQLIEDCKERNWKIGLNSREEYDVVTQPTTESSQPGGVCSISTTAQPSTIHDQTTEAYQSKVDVGQVMNPDHESWTNNNYYSDSYQNLRSGLDANNAASPNLRGFCGMVMMMTVMAVLVGT